MDEDKKYVKKSIQTQEDKAKPSKADRWKGLIFPKDLHIPNDPNLEAAMKEAEKDCEDFAKNIVYHTTIMMQEAQLTQLKLFQRLQLNFKNQAQEIDTRHQQGLKEAKEALV